MAERKKNPAVEAAEEAQAEEAIAVAIATAENPPNVDVGTVGTLIQATIFGVPVEYSTRIFTDLVFLDAQATANDPYASDDEKMTASMRMARRVLGSQTIAVYAAAGDVENFPEIVKQIMDAANPN